MDGSCNKKNDLGYMLFKIWEVYMQARERNQKQGKSVILFNTHMMKEAVRNVLIIIARRTLKRNWFEAFPDTSI